MLLLCLIIAVGILLLTVMFAFLVLLAGVLYVENTDNDGPYLFLEIRRGKKWLLKADYILLKVEHKGLPRK